MRRRRKLRHGTQEDECVFKSYPLIMLFCVFVLENSESPFKFLLI